jgi:hypothetical protein
MITLIPRKWRWHVAMVLADWAHGLTCRETGLKHAWVIEFTIAYLRNAGNRLLPVLTTWAVGSAVVTP